MSKEKIMTAEELANQIRLIVNRHNVDNKHNDIISLIESRDKQICEAQKEICSDLSETNEEAILNAPDAI